MTDLEFLRAVRVKIDTEDKWCRWALQCGDKRCLLGAALYVMGGGYVNAARLNVYAARLKLDSILHLSGRVTTFNDENDHATVLAKLDEAIQRLGGGTA